MKTLLTVLLMWLLAAARADREIIHVEGGGDDGRTEFEKSDVYKPSYCQVADKQCPGEDISARFEIAVRQCSVACNRIKDCASVYFDAQKICHLRRNRCTVDQLVEAPGGMQLYRLEKDEHCSSTTGDEYVSGNKWSRKFCLLKGKQCPTQGLDGGSLYRNLQVVRPYLSCLIKCARIWSCAGVDYYENQGGKACDMRHTMCADSELIDNPDATNYIRLEEGQDSCPGNRDDYEVPNC